MRQVTGDGVLARMNYGSKAFNRKARKETAAKIAKKSRRASEKEGDDKSKGVLRELCESLAHFAVKGFGLSVLQVQGSC